MKKLCFDHDWKFIYNGVEKRIDLPHDAMIGDKRYADAPTKSCGGYFPSGKYVYEKTFEKPNCKRAILEFEGVYGICTVWLNGKKVAKNNYGYNDFFVDVSDALVDGKNLLKVVADNSAVINSRWYSGGGIYRSVFMHCGDDVCVLPNGLRVSTPDAERDIAKVLVEIDFDSALDSAELFIETTVSDGKGEIVCRSKIPYIVFRKGAQHAEATLFIREPRLWSENSPALYDCVVAVTARGVEMDGASAAFGVRKITLDPVNGLRINGVQTLLRGACIHHDNGIIGACEYYDAAYRRIGLLKAAGFNAIRISHQPCSKPMLDACDRLGMYVLEETFDMWEEAKTPHDFSLYFDKDWKKVIESAIGKDFNHPSVIMYSIGNEIPEIIKPRGVMISRELSDHVRFLDRTRPVTNAINGLCATTGNTLPILLDLGLVTKEQVAAITGDPDSDNKALFDVILAAVATGDINDAMTALAGNLGRVVEHKSVGEKLHEPVSHLDVCGYNYMMARYAVDAREYPDRILLGTETMPPDIDLLWEKVKNIPQLIGDFTWTGWDYIGEAGVGHTNYDGKAEFAVQYPGYLAYCGDIDITGYRRPMSYLREIVYGLRKAPYISVQHPEKYGKNAKTTSWAEPETIESWTFSGYEGKHVNVKVYADADEVVLLVNGKEVGRKKPERMRAAFDTVYEAGEITAVAYKNGEAHSHTVKTAGKSALCVEFDKTEIPVDGLCYMQLEMRDKDGVLDMDEPVQIELECSENLRLLGFGTADPCATDNFFDNVHQTYNGRAIAVFRGAKRGRATVGIKCRGIVTEKEIEVI